MKTYQTAIREALNSWPIVQVKLVGNEPCIGKKGWLGWEHYKKDTRDDLLRQIEIIEKKEA